MSAPTLYETGLANRVREGLALMCTNKATPLEQSRFIAEIFADYRSNLVPRGSNKENRMHKKEDVKTWTEALALINSNDKLAARKLIRQHIKPENRIPSTLLVFRVLSSLLEDDVVSWGQEKENVI